MLDRVPVLMDVDTGVDDAMALALATQIESCELVGVTTVAGNVTVDHATRNTLNVLEWMGASVPVSRGMSEPLSRPLYTATEVHGDDGIGGWKIPTAKRDITGESAPQMILRLSAEYAGQLRLVFVGPLTNLAVALKLDPTLPSRVAKLVIMGGAFWKPGNVTSHAEFNIFVDPEAAGVVSRAGFDCTWVGLDVTQQVRIESPKWRSLDRKESAGAELVREICRESFEEQGRDGFTLHDPLAIAAALVPELLGCDQGQVTIATDSFRRGETRLTSVSGEVQQSAARDVDADRFLSLFDELLLKD